MRNAQMAEAETLKFLLDPYLDWTKSEGIPVHEGFGVDLFELETAHWPRFDAKGAFVHLTGRGDFVSCYLLDIAAGKKTRPINHLYECMFYVLEGQGSTTVEGPDGSSHSFEWGPKSLFVIPLNARYQIFNGSGSERVLLACVHNLPLTMNLYHQDSFIFDNPARFPERMGEANHFEGEGIFHPVRPGRHMWETNFVPDLTNFELRPWEARGAGSASIAFTLADGSMHAHTSEIPEARYKKGHRHGDGFHIFAVTGDGFTLFWNEGDQEFTRVPWRHGILYAPPFMMFHQHFNTGPSPARYLATCLGSRRYPILTVRRTGIEMAGDTSIKKGGRQIEYEDQDPRIHGMWLEDIGRTGVPSDMGHLIDETTYTKG
jgi:mannose-6-phosphate isomerase-like protein (cupin superfamily)